MTQRNSATSTTSHRVPHRVTVRKTAYQVGKLQEMWATTHTPTKEQREQIADEIGLETRIVSTWFRDERSKETRARAEKQRMERGTVGPVRNTRTSTALRRGGDESIGAVSDEEEEDAQETPLLDRHTVQQRSPQPHSLRDTRASPRTRYTPYDLNSNTPNVSKKPLQPRHTHFDPLIRASVPIDWNQGAETSNHLTDTESFGYPSPNAYPRQSLPAPSIYSSSETSGEDEDEELLEEDKEGVLFTRHLDRPREFSPRTPALVPSTIPSPRVFQHSTSPSATLLPPISTLGPSSPSNYVSTSPLFQTKSAVSPYNQPITIPTQSGGSYTFKPLPVIVGPLPRRDSTWRFNYYDKVSNVRQTLGNKLYHDGSSSSIYRTATRDDESDADSVSEDGISTSNHGILSGLGGLFGGAGKKQLFASN